jgi:hypothetical protein
MCVAAWKTTHTSHYAHFLNNDSATEKNYPNYGRVWEMRNVSDSLNDNCSYITLLLDIWPWMKL